MERVLIGRIREHLNETILIQGFVDNFRNSSKMAFIVLKDITGKVQVTVEKELHQDLLEALDQITPDSVISVTGVCSESEYVKLNGLEVIPETIVVESVAAALPIQREEIPATKKKPAVPKSGVDERLDYRWIDLRTDKNQLLFKLQTAITRALRDFVLDREFIEVHTPKLIATASESGSEVFEVSYFERKAYLAQSPQFYKQMAMAAGFDRIFEVGPVFRAEKSFTNKHATEFTGFDVEMSYITSFRDVMAFEAELLQ
ncbi:MAG: aspartate--tRNA(Asn) ligase, partial [Lachnospiraceae bacterium]|nr:aspartate--tRNA(Asn) ligase [Lachnospiraceae bacterium]